MLQPAQRLLHNRLEMTGWIRVAGGSQFAERAIDRFVFPCELGGQLFGGLIDRNQPFKFPQARRVAGEDLLELLPHARNPSTIDRVAALELLFFKSFRPVALTADQPRRPASPPIQERPKGPEAHRVG